MDTAAAANLDPGAFIRACDGARRHAERTTDPHQALDAALDTLGDAGPAVLASVFIVEHDRLWLVAQRGYSSVPDGLALTEGVMGRAARGRSCEFVGDVADDEDYVAGSTLAVGEAALPLLAGCDLLGVLNVETLAPLPEASYEPLERLAAALAPRVAQLGTALDLSALARLFVHSSSLREVGDIATLAARSLGRALDLDSAHVTVRVDGALRTAAAWRRPGAARPSPDVETLVGLAHEASERTVMTSVPGATADERLVLLPLRAAGAEIGVIVGRSRGCEAIGREASEVATLIAAHTAALIDVALALASERRAASTDALTGALNRRAFDARLEEELDAARGGGGGLGLLLVDCDGLKALNDAHGHAAGDALLRRVTSCLLRSVGTRDTVARIGGDEFAVVLPGSTHVEARRVSGRIRRAAAGSVSVGFAVYPGDGDSAHALMRAADRRLYRAKRNGVPTSLAG